MKMGIYKHYKGKFYQVLGVALHTETLEEVVVYQSLHEPFSLWARPRVMFEETVIFNEVTILRFQYISPGITESQKI